MDNGCIKNGKRKTRKSFFLTGVFAWACIFLPVISSEAKTVQYELNVTRGKMNLSGKKTVDFALRVNGTIPAPTLEFTEGDDAEITVKNSLNEEVSIHWHGLLLPPEEDGVAYVNTPPIMPGKSRVFKFKIRQHGTYWYHSHTMLQEQKGVFGALVIHPLKPSLKVDHEWVAILSDWTDENPDQVLKNLRKDGDYYLYKKDTVRSWLGAIQAKSLGSFLENEWIRMGGMDLSDVGYDAFLVNGKRSVQFTGTKRPIRPGDRIRVRVINAAASSYFYLTLGNEPLKVISADGVDVKPVQGNRILLGMAETIDLLVEIPKAEGGEIPNLELRATCQDVTGYASAWMGNPNGKRISAPDVPVPNLYASMDHGAHTNHGANHESNSADEGHSGHSSHSAHNKHGAHSGHAAHETVQNPVHEEITVDQLKSPEKTAFSESIRRTDIKFVLGGDMERYIWHLNGKTIQQDTFVDVNEGDVIRFTFENQTMMHHPMHLHGHFFRVINEAGEHSPLKHTVDVPPHGSRTIEFLANERGQWMLHCHNLYHMKTGMARVIKYRSFEQSSEMKAHAKHDSHLHDHLYTFTRLEASTNHAQADFHLMRTWDLIEIHGETRDYDSLNHAEGDLFYHRYFSNFFRVTAGGTYMAEFVENDFRGILGVGYVLPMLIESQVFIDSKGEFRFDLEKKFQWTKWIYTDAEMVWRQNAELEFEINLMYAPNWHWAGGLMFTEDSMGVGLQVRF